MESKEPKEVTESKESKEVMESKEPKESWGMRMRVRVLA
jgi:hypothetical protein